MGRRALGAVLAAALFLLVAVAIIAPASGSAPPAPAAAAGPLIYYNGTVDGNGGTQTKYIPSPANGTVWDLVSAKITITATSAVSSLQNSYLYDSTCTQSGVAPAPSACEGIYGPNVDGWANDLLESGSGTVVGEGGYASSAPSGVKYYTHFEQTMHLTYDMFVSFGAQLSSGVTSSYAIVLQAESGVYPSYAFYQYSHPVKPLSSTPTTVAIAGPPAGYDYRVEIAWTTIEFGSALGPSRLAELQVESSGFVLAKIDSWPSGYSGASACGGYSSAQTCISDNGVGTETVWDSQVLVTSSDSFQATFVGVSGDEGVYAIIVTEYPASMFSSSSSGGGTTVTPTTPTTMILGFEETFWFGVVLLLIGVLGIFVLRPPIVFVVLILGGVALIVVGLVMGTGASVSLGG